MAKLIPTTVSLKIHAWKTAVVQKWQAYTLSLKSNRTTQVVTISLLILILTVTGSLILSLRTRRQIAFQQPLFAHPSPSPQPKTRFANHPAIINTEQELASLEATTSSLVIQKHPLLPPSLDMNVTLIQ